MKVLIRRKSTVKTEWLVARKDREWFTVGQGLPPEDFEKDILPRRYIEFRRREIMRG